MMSIHEPIFALISAAQVDLNAVLNDSRDKMIEHLNDAIENLNRAIDMLEEKR